MELEMQEALVPRAGSLKPGVTVSQVCDMIERDYARCGVTTITHVDLTGIDRVLRIGTRTQTRDGQAVYFMVMLGHHLHGGVVPVVMFAAVDDAPTPRFGHGRLVDWIEICRERRELWRHLMNLRPRLPFGRS